MGFRAGKSIYDRESRFGVEVDMTGKVNTAWKRI